jgi:hypothetical protein
LQRRLSVSGVDALPGFDFRRTFDGVEVGTCTPAVDAAFLEAGRPALCERVLLLQAEWKGDFRVHLFGDAEDYGDRRFVAGRVRADGNWVVFANTGRGWTVRDPASAGLRFGASRLPPASTWRTDLGAGLDFGTFGVYVAQAVSRGGESPNVFMRLGRRF